MVAVALFHPASAFPLDQGALSRTPDAGVGWLYGVSENAVDAVFAEAKLAGKPILLYWGATWCPPCNQLRATLFNRRDFIALTSAVVAVYMDGDLPGAQKQGSRFHVVGYPTLILFAPDGMEITRLPGEADATRIVASLKAGLTGGRPASLVLAEARAGKALSSSEWLALAFYAWEADEEQLVRRDQRADVLAELAQRSQPVSTEASTRLWLKSLVAWDRESASPEKASASAPEHRTRLLDVLRNRAELRRNADVIMEGAKAIVLTLSGTSGARGELLAEYGAALGRLQNDVQLSRADRTSALIARVDLERLDVASGTTDVSLPLPLLAEVRLLARRMDKEVSNGFERQAVITSVAYLLGQAGLWSESDALLKANLKRSHAPYYLMSQLGGNARKLGRKSDALDWYERAYQTSKGPATRLQWGAGYVSALVDLAPEQSGRIEKAVMDLFADAERDTGAFYERSGRSLGRVTDKISAWNKENEHAAEVNRMRDRHRRLCHRSSVSDSQRRLCEALWAES